MFLLELALEIDRLLDVEGLPPHDDQLVERRRIDVEGVARYGLYLLAQVPRRHLFEIALQQSLRVAFEGREPAAFGEVYPLGALGVHGDVLGLLRTVRQAFQGGAAVVRRPSRTRDPERRVEALLRGLRERPRVAVYQDGRDLPGGGKIRPKDHRAVFGEGEEQLWLRVYGDVGRRPAGVVAAHHAQRVDVQLADTARLGAGYVRKPWFPGVQGDVLPEVP